MGSLLELSLPLVVSVKTTFIYVVIILVCSANSFCQGAGCSVAHARARTHARTCTHTHCRHISSGCRVTGASAWQAARSRSIAAQFSISVEMGHLNGDLLNVCAVARKKRMAFIDIVSTSSAKSERSRLVFFFIGETLSLDVADMDDIKTSHRALLLLLSPIINPPHISSVMYFPKTSVFHSHQA